ncbi:hypothetical protein [Sphingobium yanoikuyae]|uniref:hypothetical protein n=1 Tax=Sphingobium yanoikuyae TaxID=13690 RepID=UPI0026EAF347|nr:hypothetical protein [Sphingobium yanoikuyae]
MTDAVKPATDGVFISRELLAFLCGDGPLDGHYFGEKPDHERGNFWWRKALRAAENAALEQAGEPVVDVCPECGGSGEIFSHADDCWSDDCALALGIDDCDGQVLPCSCAEPPLPTLQRLGQEFDAGETEPVADAGGVTEDDVIGLINIVTDLAEVDALDKAYPEVWGRLDAMVNHAVAAATAGMPTIWEDPAGKGYPCFERPMTPAEARATIDRYGREIARMREALTAIAEQQEHEIALDPDWPRRIARAALSEAREAGDSLAAGDRV